MLCCIAEIAVLIFGILAVVKGQFSLTRNRVCRGWSARSVGIILIVTPILAAGISFAIGLSYGVQAGFQAAQQGQQVRLDPAKVREIERITLAVQAGIFIVGLAAAFVVALVTAKPRRRPRDEYDDYEDDRPRRRDEDDDYNRPQRPRDDRDDR